MRRAPASASERRGCDDARDRARRGERNGRRSGAGRAIAGEDEARAPTIGYLETRRAIVHRETRIAIRRRTLGSSKTMDGRPRVRRYFSSHDIDES